MFSLANFQATLPSQVFFKSSERKCSWQKFSEATVRNPSVKNFKMLLQLYQKMAM